MIDEIREVLNAMPKYRMLRFHLGNQETGEDSYERIFGMVRRYGMLYSVARTVRSPHNPIDLSRIVCISSPIGRPKTYWQHPLYVKPQFELVRLGTLFLVGSLESFSTEKKAIQWAKRMDYTLVSSKHVLTSTSATQPASD